MTTATTTPATAPARATPPGAALVQVGTLADVTAAERLVQPLAPPGVSEGDSHGLSRLALAHLALTCGGLWVVRDGRGGLLTAAALLPAGGHPDVAGLAWMAHVQLGLPVPRGPLQPGRPEQRLLLPPRRAGLARLVVDAALLAAPRDVACPRPCDPGVLAVLLEAGFEQRGAPGLLQRGA